MKFWRWGIFHRKPKEAVPPKEKGKKDDKEKPPKLYPARNCVLVTSESNMSLEPCKVLDDHQIKFHNKTVQIKPDRPAHVLTIPCRQIWPTFIGRMLSPKKQRFRVYTVQEEGELTHDPHLDHLTDEMKMRFEKTLQLMGRFAEVDAGAVLYEGIKGPKKWFDYIPYIVIGVIVFFFLFAFQIQPNM